MPISVAKARAKLVYERLINFTDDQGTIDALQFLMTREISHMKAFSAALESMDKPAFSQNRRPALQRRKRYPRSVARCNEGMTLFTGMVRTRPERPLKYRRKI